MPATWMKPKVSGRRGGAPAWSRYAFALVVTAIAFLLTTLFQTLVASTLFLFFFTAVLVSAWCAGLGPGLLTTVLTLAAANYFIITPSGRWTVGAGDVLGLLVFGAVAILLSTLSESRRASQRRAAEEALQTRQLARQLEQSNERLRNSVAEAEAALRLAKTAMGQHAESEARFRTMADTAPVLIWTADTAGRRTYFNRPWLEFTGRDVQHELGDGWADAIHPDDVEAYRARYDSWLSRGEAFTMEYRLRRYDGEYRWILDTGVPRTGPEGEFAGLIGSGVDITRRKEAETTQHFLLDAARLLASSLDFETTLHQVTSLLVPQFADYALIHLLGEDGSFRQVAAAHSEADKMLLLEELGRFYQPQPDNPGSMVARAWKTGTPVLMPEGSLEAWSMLHGHEVLRISRALGRRSHAVVPLVARGGAIGTISVGISSSRRHHHTSDVTLLELLELFGARAALAIDNAKLHTELRRAHERDLRTSQLESQLAQAQLETLRAQLNPHFLFNALNTIAMLIRREANTAALQGIVGLSQLLRQVLDRRSTPEVCLGEELALVEHYLAVEQLRFRDRLGVHMSVPPDLLGAQVPSLILQPIVENAVRHGIARRGQPGRIDIIGRRRHSTLRLEVRDDGPGFPDDWVPEHSSGIGLANTKERLQRLYGSDHHLKARNSRSGGAVVSVTIPFRTA